MTIQDVLGTEDGRRSIEALAAAYGITPAQARSAVVAVMPELVAGLERNTLSRGGLADLLRALSTGGHERYLDPAGNLADPALKADGDKILGHILRSDARVQRVASGAAEEAGISSVLLRTMLPAIAALLMGWLFRSGKGALGDVLGKAGPVARDASSFPRMDPLPGPAGGRSRSGGGPLPLPDFDSMEQKDRSRVGGNPYGDLSDIVRGGKAGGLAGSIRDILGGLLGFQSKSWIGWIIRLIVVRYGWRILQAVLRSLLGRR